MVLSTAVVGLAIATLLYAIVGAFLRWRRSNTAVEMESAFPELGQAVRTSVQYGTQKTAEYGVAPRLVEALHATTERRASATSGFEKCGHRRRGRGGKCVPGDPR